MTKNFPGVRKRECVSQGKKDIYFSIRYTVNGKQYEEPIGFKSLGWTAEKAYHILGDLKQRIKAGTAFSLKEIAQQQQKKNNELLERNKRNCIQSKTFREIFSLCYMPYCQIYHKKSTNDRELVLFKKWLEPYFGSLPLEKISRNSLIRVQNIMADQQLSVRSQNYAIALMRQVFNFAKKENLYFGLENPASKIKCKKEDNRRIRYLTAEELEALFTELKKRSYEVYLMALISADCGLRAGEIFNLTWADVNLNQKEFTLKDTKNKKNRFAFMTDRVFEEVSKLPNKETNQHLFPSRNGKKIEHVSRTYERAVKKLGLNQGITDRRQKVVFHTLRHTYASRLVEKGNSIFVVKELLGHSDISMTLRYSHLSNNSLRKAVRTLNSESEND